jgi:hypothetical protein
MPAIRLMRQAHAWVRAFVLTFAFVPPAFDHKTTKPKLFPRWAPSNWGC